MAYKAQLYFMKDLVQIMGVHHKTIRRWMANGELARPKKLSSRYVWLAADIHKWLLSKGMELPPDAPK